MQHIIQHQLFDIAYTNAGRAYDLQSKVSDIFNSRLVTGMEELFDRLVPEDVVLSLDEVSIDIGNITYNRLDYDLADRILAELEREIKYRLLLGQGGAIEATDKQGQEQVKSLQASYTDLLEYFLLTGTMPWWATGELMLDPLKVIEQLLTDDANGLKQLIVRVGQHGYVRQRIVNQFTDKVIRRIVSLLEPAEAEFIFDYHATAVKVHSEKKLVDSAPNNEFEKALWLFILTYLLVDRGSLFNQKIFVRSTLGQMAQHYNREYAELLILLNKVLNNERLRTQQSGYLPLIIHELFSEEADIRYIDNDITSNVYNEEGASGQDIELIRHYLAFGSLPWWAEPYTQNDVSGLFMSLIKAAPKTLRSVIISVGQNEAARARMVAVFNDEVIEAVVKLLEPANAQFIISYVAEVQQLHVKKVVVQTDSKDFKKAVWKFVLDFLLIERGSEFNQRMFLQSNIKRLADNYNVQYRDVLLYFVQSISQLHQGSIEHAPLFKLLASLLQEDPQVSLAALKSSASLNDHISEQINDEQRVVVLKDILLHWLKYGNIPWWGKAYFDWTPAAMFESLFTSSPTDVAMLLKYAATTINMQQRIMYQLPPQFMLDVLKLYPQGDSAVKLYHYLSALLPALIKSKQTDIEKIQKELVLILWNVFDQGQYRKFDAAAFLSAVVNHLSQKHNVLPSAILKALKAKFNTVDGQVYTQLLNELPATTFNPNDWLISLVNNGGADIYLLIKEYLDREAASESYITNEAFNILAFFIANNKLPEQFKGTNPAFVNAIIKQLLQFLNKTDSNRLKRVLNTSGRSELHDLIKADETSAQIDGGIEQIITAYLTGDKIRQTGTLISEALRVLEYFLVNGKVPEYLSRIDIQDALKQLLVLLNYEEQSALNSLLQKDGHSAAARMQLHNAFARPLNTAESNISNTLRSYFERDVISYLKQTAAINFSTESDSKLAELLEPYISKTQNLAFITVLLKQTAVARYIALNYTDDVVFTLLAGQSNSVGGSENVEWIKQLQRFFNEQFTDTLLRDRFNNLFKEFNLLILGEHLAAKTPEAYLKALFGFISSANNTLFVQLSKILPTIAINSPIALKLPLLAETIKQQQQADEAIRQVKQSLKEADEQALKRVTKADDAGSENNNDMDKEKDNLMNSKDTIYISNAGLVLLNPFFATYFIRLGMMKDGKFIDIDTQHRAVHLLQYLVNNEEQSPEHTLVLNKILCNVPIAEAIPLGITITENEKQVSADLLKAVTERWEKMQNTSIPGFQASFLQRSGALLYKDDAWHLRVEQRGYDVLLQTLPWNIGMIKTPWMDNFLYVEWT